MTSITKADDSGGRPTYVGLGAPIDPCVSLSLSLSPFYGIRTVL